MIFWKFYVIEQHLTVKWKENEDFDDGICQNVMFIVLYCVFNGVKNCLVAEICYTNWLTQRFQIVFYK